jgi:flagellar FliL protein
MADDNQESKGSGGGNNANSSHEESKKADSHEKADLSFKADITELVLNLTDSKGKEKLMKLSFSIKSSEPTIAAIIEETKPEIVDVVISQISSRSSEELLTVGGKNLLKDELLQEINSIVNEATKSKPEVAKNNIKQIFFTTFVIK